MRRSLLLLLLLVAPAAVAQERAAPVVLPPPPPHARSVEVVNADAPVFLAPRRGATRRGTLARGARFPIGRRLDADGCSRAWVELRPDDAPPVYVCERHLRYTTATPRAARHPHVPEGSLLPHDYAFVSVDGTRAYARPEDYFTDQYHEALGAGFGLIVRDAMMYRGVPFTRTRRGLYVESDALRRARGSDFAGVRFEDDAALDVAWAGRRGARIYDARRRRVLRRAGPREVLRTSGAEAPRGWLALAGSTEGEGRFVRTREVHVAEPQDRPEELDAGATWLDVAIDSQVLVAYEDSQPRYATLVSTGRAGRHHATPLGLHRVWVKLAFSDMDNLQRDDLETNYAIERVPWVQYFEGANGLHAAFWHDEFGRRKSHGCVNLSPRDARALFEFTRPGLPPGWTAIFPLPTEPTTHVRVR